MQGRRVHKVQKTSRTIKHCWQRFRREEAAARRHRASTESLKATSHQLEAFAQALKAEQEQVAGRLAYTKMLTYAIRHEGVHASSDCRKDMACS